MAEKKFKLPTEQVDLPSKGLIYPVDNPLSSGVIEMSYMTALQEDILTNQNYMAKGTVFDKLIESMIVDKINMDDLVLGDKNALLIAARILGYGKDYTFKTYENGELVEKNIDLSEIKDIEFDPTNLITPRVNEFSYDLPSSKNNVTFKLLTHGDDKKIFSEIESLKKLFPQKSPTEVSTRLKYMITSVNGDRESSTIRDFVDNGLLAMDSQSLRKEYKRVSPDIDLVYKKEDEDEGTPIPINIRFFWPESTV